MLTDEAIGDGEAYQLRAVRTCDLYGRRMRCGALLTVLRHEGTSGRLVVLCIQRPK